MVHGEVNTRLLSLIDASPDAQSCTLAEAREWAQRLQDEIERMRDVE